LTLKTGFGSVTGDGDLRTLACCLPDADSRFAGLDGFYAARLVRRPL
jgi:16S rRNA (cytosine967-C5)-methyltransferase